MSVTCIQGSCTAQQDGTDVVQYAQIQHELSTQSLVSEFDLSLRWCKNCVNSEESSCWPVIDCVNPWHLCRFAHAQQLKDVNISLTFHMASGMRARPPACIPLQVSRHLEARLAEAEGVSNVRHWLRLIGPCSTLQFKLV